jgi:hypothetical protein
MGQTTLVGNQITDAERLVSRLVEKGFSISAASWVKTSEEGLWFLYVVSRAVDDFGLAQAYRRLNAAAGPMSDLWVSPFDIKLVGTNNPIARDMLEALARAPTPATVPIRYAGTRLGSVRIEEAYIYPPHHKQS